MMKFGSQTGEKWAPRGSLQTHIQEYYHMKMKAQLGHASTRCEGCQQATRPGGKACTRFFLPALRRNQPC